MRDNAWSVIWGIVNLVGTAVATIISGVVRIATSPTVRNGIRTIATTSVSVLVTIIVGGWLMIERRSPTIRKLFRTGLLGGFRMFRSQFNRNSPNMVRNTRTQLYPLNWISVVATVAVAYFFTPLVGAMWLIGTYIVFFKDAETLPLTSFSADTAGVGGYAGIGTSLILNVFKVIGAATTTSRWVRSQL